MAGRRQPSRRERYAAAMTAVANERDVVEELRDELQHWLDSMPENLQESAKADELQEAIDVLDDVVAALDDAESAEVVFPGMI